MEFSSEIISYSSFIKGMVSINGSPKFTKDDGKNVVIWKFFFRIFLKKDISQ